VEGLDVEVAPTTVTLRERGVTNLPNEVVVTETGVWDESRWGQSVWGPSPAVAETGVYGESRYDSGAVYADASVHESPSRFEAILGIIGSGSFPKAGSRDNLSQGERRQLRDAMILEAHTRDGRDVLVSNDRRAFIGKDGENRASARSPLPHTDHDRGRILRRGRLARTADALIETSESTSKQGSLL
jgi:hypothetical protein